MKTLPIFTFLLALVVIGLSCRAGNDADVQDAENVERQQLQYAANQPVPFFEYSLEREIVRQLYQARNERVSTHTVWRSDMGTLEGDCPSIGYPIPYDTSLTNPLVGNYYRSGGTVVVAQAEPNGLFASENSIATWVRCTVTVGGQVYEAPIYIESKVTAYPFPVNVDYETGRVMPVQTRPSVTLDYTQ